MSVRGWIGTDLDGTLAYYHGWNGADHIGKPIPAMVKRVKGWLALGYEVRVFTARMSHDPDGTVAAAIRAWTKEHIGQELVPTCTKDFEMLYLWDDRAIRVGFNTGEPSASSDMHL